MYLVEFQNMPFGVSGERWHSRPQILCTLVADTGVLSAEFWCESRSIELLRCPKRRPDCTGHGYFQSVVMCDTQHPITHPPESCISEPATPFANDGTSCADKASCNYNCATGYVVTAGTEPEAVTCATAGTGWNTMTPATLVCSGCSVW